MPRGRIQLEGRFIDRLALIQKEAVDNLGCRRPQETNRIVVLNFGPGPVIEAPAETYGSQRIVLQKRSAYSLRNQPLKVAENQTLSLWLGGPLENRILVRAENDALVLNYRLQGAGGEDYTLMDSPRTADFAIYNGPWKIGAGTLEFG